MASIDARVGQREIEAARDAERDWEHEEARRFNVENPQDVDWAMEQQANAGPTMGGGPQRSAENEASGLIGRVASTGMPSDPTFSGSNAIIDVDTFEDIQKAQEATTRRQAQADAMQRFDSVTGNPAISTGLQVDNFSNINAAFARTMGNVETGSVNLAPIGINVGYQSNIGKVDTFDDLDESTKAAVEAAHIQSQSEDETENAIAQIFSAFQNILNKASKNTTNRQMGGSGSMGTDQ